MEGDLPEVDLGHRLHAQGWKQGTIFSATSLYFLSNHLPQQTEGKGYGRRAIRPNERLVVVSQDCDIVVHQDTEPCVETLICVIEQNADRIKSLDANSTRNFVIDPDHGLIAQAKFKVLLTKALLTTLDPEPWPTDATRHQRFVRWLARRYDRPPVPDQLDMAFRRTIEEGLKQLRRKQADIINDFTSAVHEVRYSIPRTETLPYTLSIIMLSRADHVTNRQLGAIQHVKEMIRAVVDSTQVEIRDIAVTTDRDITLAEYRDTWPLFLEYYTYKGSEVEGVEPLQQV
jgi:hypothetical protein